MLHHRQRRPPDLILARLRGRDEIISSPINTSRATAKGNGSAASKPAKREKGFFGRGQTLEAHFLPPATHLSWRRTNYRPAGGPMI